MTSIDVFNAPNYSVRELSEAINVVPNKYGRLNELNLFPEKGIATTYVEVEFKNGVLHLLPTKERGAPGTLGKSAKRNVKIFKCFHIPHQDSVTADDVQNARRFGSANDAEDVDNAVNDKLIEMADKHFITLEHLRAGALSGTILDADGTTLINLFDEFGVTQKSVNFDFAGSPDVGASIKEVQRHMEDYLLGDTMTGIRALCSEQFFDALIADEQCAAAYTYFTSNFNPLRDDVRRYFPHLGIIFEEYRGRASYLNEDGTTTVRKFIPDGEARFVPMGTTKAFRTFFAPADYMESVNTQGLRTYAKQEPKKFGKGIDIETQSNPLPLCMRPQLLVKGTST